VTCPFASLGSAGWGEASPTFEIFAWRNETGGADSNSVDLRRALNQKKPCMNEIRPRHSIAAGADEFSVSLSVQNHAAYRNPPRGNDTANMPPAHWGFAPGEIGCRSWTPGPIFAGFVRVAAGTHLIGSNVCSVNGKQCSRKKRSSIGASTKGKPERGPVRPARNSVKANDQRSPADSVGIGVLESDGARLFVGARAAGSRPFTPTNTNQRPTGLGPKRSPGNGATFFWWMDHTDWVIFPQIFHDQPLALELLLYMVAIQAPWPLVE